MSTDDLRNKSCSKAAFGKALMNLKPGESWRLSAGCAHMESGGGAATYKVYRSQTSGSGYQPIAVIDTDPLHGRAGELGCAHGLFYVVSSVTATNIESVFSSQVTATPVA